MKTVKHFERSILMKKTVHFLVALSFTTTLFGQSDKSMELECVGTFVARSEVRSISDGNPAKLTTTPVNSIGEHVAGLGIKDFRITKGRKTAEIISVKELTAMENTVMRITFMVDNSQSMSPYVPLLRSTLETVITGFSDAVRLSIIFFNEQQQAEPAFDYNGKPLSLVRLPYVYDKKRAVNYAKNMLAERLLTRNTYLYDGVYGTLKQILSDTGRVDRSFAIIFSDGKDNASKVDPETVLRAGKEHTTFYTIDYLTEANDFLIRLAKVSGGEHYQAKSANEITTIFEQIAKKIVAKGYEITYRFKEPPSASIVASTESLVMEEDIVRETFPLLNYIFFEQGSAIIPDRYVKLSSEQVSPFDESTIEGGAMDFYYNVLNVLGSRMKRRPESTVQISGYLNEHETERKNRTLAMDRAKAVQDYLKTIWGIEDHRLTLSAGSLPPTPSSQREEEGRAENRRVEITSDDWELLKPVTFVRRTASVNPETVQFTLDTKAEEGIESWKLKIMQADREFDERRGVHFEPRITWNWKNKKGEIVASSGDVHAVLEIGDNGGDKVIAQTKKIRVSEVRRERNLNVTTEDGITKEKISLILFPFDVSTPGEKNERIMNTFVYPRIATGSRITVTGYTDIIGSEEYNMRLSQARADETLKLLLTRMAGVIPDTDITATGLGETSPLYRNDGPEGRFYNRTVSILIERNPVRQ